MLCIDFVITISITELVKDAVRVCQLAQFHRQTGNSRPNILQNDFKQKCRKHVFNFEFSKL